MKERERERERKVIAETKIPEEKSGARRAQRLPSGSESSRAGRAEIRLWTNRVINTYGRPQTQSRTLTSHTLARACVKPDETRILSYRWAAFAREIFHSAVSPFRLPFARTRLSGQRLPRVVSLRPAIREEKRERKRKREGEKGE